MNLQPFRVDIDDLDHQCFCLGQLKRLKEQVAHAKEKNIELVYRFVNNMIDRNLFPFRASEFNEGYIEEEASELTNVENACAQHPNKRLRADTEIESYNQEAVYQKTGLNERQMQENQSQKSTRTLTSIKLQ
nr:hypothetical protein [Tanacetum cinerariifolium]